MKDELSTITLYDENGNEEIFDVIVKLDIETNEYFVVASKESKNDEEAIILKVVTDENGEEIFETVEDENEFEIVSEAYYTLFEENE